MVTEGAVLRIRYFAITAVVRIGAEPRHDGLQAKQASAATALDNQEKEHYRLKRAALELSASDVPHVSSGAPEQSISHVPDLYCFCRVTAPFEPQ